VIEIAFEARLGIPSIAALEGAIQQTPGLRGVPRDWEEGSPRKAGGQTVAPGTLLRFRCRQRDPDEVFAQLLGSAALALREELLAARPTGRLVVSVGRWSFAVADGLDESTLRRELSGALRFLRGHPADATTGGRPGRARLRWSDADATWVLEADLP